MSAFTDRFSMTKSSSESAERMRKPGTRLGLTIGDFSDVMIGTCLSRRVLLYDVNRQSREFGGLVIS